MGEDLDQRCVPRTLFGTYSRSMDMVRGAVELDWLIRSRQQWRSAEAVRCGHQSGVDPDEANLVEMTDGGRHYERDIGRRWTKVLVEGWWQVERTQT